MEVSAIDNLKIFLDEKVEQYNQPNFIENDPISIPHQYRKKQDIEITGLWTALLSWGQRITIIRKCNELFERMDHAPHDFLLNHSEDDLKPFLDFKHRTFNDIDTLYFIYFLSWYYRQNESLEDAFISSLDEEVHPMERGIMKFHNLFFSLPDHPHRTKKHVPTPARGSACKRVNMFLRWMVRSDGNGVDFGIWTKIKPSQLICPCDLHVDRVARRFGLIQRKNTDWQTSLELTENLRMLDSEDPVKYDFALFGLGIEERY